MATPQGLAKSLESKVTAAVLLASALGLAAYALQLPALLSGGDWSAELGAQVQTFAGLFDTSALAHVSTLDLSILSVMFPFTAIEDMQRRGWYQNGDLRDKATVALFSVPVVGPCAYLLLRPPLPGN